MRSIASRVRTTKAKRIRLSATNNRTDDELKDLQTPSSNVIDLAADKGGASVRFAAVNRWLRYLFTRDHVVFLLLKPAKRPILGSKSPGSDEYWQKRQRREVEDGAVHVPGRLYRG
jgi:hypothetical protein